MHVNTFKFWIKVNVLKWKTANNGNTELKKTPKGTSMVSFHEATLSSSNSNSMRIFYTQSGKTLLNDS
jgi:hypothetical protein